MGGRAALAAISGVNDFEVDRQINAKSEMRHQFSMVFADQTAYSAYNAHPAHVDFVQTRWLPEVTAFQELDFEAL